MAYTPPADMTYAELMKWQVPSGLQKGTRSYAPRELEEMHGAEGWVPLFFKGMPRDHVDRLLGKNTPYWDQGQAANARFGQPVEAYRTTTAEDELWPGSWVTLSPKVAEDHQRRQLMGGGKMVKGYVHPGELWVPPNHPGIQEFVYAPKDVARWHRGAALAAREDGKPVHPDLAPYLPPPVPDNLRRYYQFQRSPGGEAGRVAGIVRGATRDLNRQR